MNDKPVHPHELLEHNTRLKKHILNQLFRTVLALIITPAVLYALYNPPMLVNRILFGVETTEVNELEQRYRDLEQKTNRQKQQIESQNQLITQLKKRNSAVSGVPKSEQLHLPVVSPRFISWQIYSQQHPGAKFSDFRDAKEKHLTQQLERCIAFFHSLKNSR